MTKKANFIFILLGAIFFISLAETTADAQRRRTTTRRNTTTAARTPAATTTTANTAAIKDGAQKVGNQIVNLTRFIYLLGNSVNLINSVEAEAKSGKVSQATRDKAELGKKGLLVTFRTFTDAMTALERDFRANPALKPYLLQLVGVSELASEAEQQAGRGQYEQAGRGLINVVEQLTEVLKAMP